MADRQRERALRWGVLLAVGVFLACGLALAPLVKAHASVLEAASALSAQTGSISIVSPEKGAKFIVGQEVNITANSRIYLFQYGYPVSNFVTFKVTKGGKKVFYGSDYYNQGSWTTSVSFTPKKPGKYKIEVAGPSFSQKDPSDFSASDSITITVKKPAAFKTIVPQVTSSRTSPTSVEISWENSGTSAKVFRSTTRNGKYKLIKTTKETSYVDKVSAKKDYFYKVQLCLKYGKKTYTSKLSGEESKFVTKPAKPTIKSVTKAKKNVKLAWKQSTDCGHFTIYRSTKKSGGYEVIGYVGGNEYSFIDTCEKKKGKKYYYKVEACNYMDWSGEIKGTMSAMKAYKA